MSVSTTLTVCRFLLVALLSALLSATVRADSNTVSDTIGPSFAVQYLTNDVGEVSSNFTSSGEFQPEDLLAVPAGEGGSCGTVYGAASNGVSFGDVIAGQVYIYFAAGSCGYNGNGCASDASGSITAGTCSSQTNAPGGFTCPGLQCWSLVGKIAGGACFQLGSSGTFTASASGALVLYFNDDNYHDNSSAYAVCITTVPELCAGLPANLSTGVSLGNVVEG